MRLYEAWKQTDWESVQSQLIDCYNLDLKELSQFRKAYVEVSNLLPSQKTSKMTMTINIFKKDYVFNVLGISDGEHFSLEYDEWENWLSYKIDEKTLCMPVTEIIAHCLWEMTWAGFSQEEIMNEVLEIMRIANEKK